MDRDQQINLLYLLALLVLPVMALVARYNMRKHGRRGVTAQVGDHTYQGEYWVEDGIVCVRCEAGRKGRLVGPQGVAATAEALLIDIYREAGQPEA